MRRAIFEAAKGGNAALRRAIGRAREALAAAALCVAAVPLARVEPLIELMRTTAAVPRRRRRLAHGHIVDGLLQNRVDERQRGVAARAALARRNQRVRAIAPRNETRIKQLSLQR